VAYLFEQAGKIALDQLVERSITAQHAVRHNVSVSDAEVSARLAEFRSPPSSVLSRPGWTAKASRKKPGESAPITPTWRKKS
jgi:hypothetical protein